MSSGGLPSDLISLISSFLSVLSAAIADSNSGKALAKAYSHSERIFSDFSVSLAACS